MKVHSEHDNRSVFALVSLTSCYFPGSDQYKISRQLRNMLSRS